VFEWGPTFGDAFSIQNDSDGGLKGSTNMSKVYNNDTGLDGETLLTGSEHFKVKEVEVFWIFTGNLWPWIVQPSPQPGGLDSRIIADIPEIFAEFRGKRLQILWRGSRDGFGAAEFHRRCDNHVNTVTVILNTEGDIFGGFTPVPWDSRDFSYSEEHCQGNDSLKTCLFTLKNTFSVPPRKLLLKEDMKSQAINCNRNLGQVLVMKVICLFPITATQIETVGLTVLEVLTSMTSR
jgi:hypothetical protein